MLLQDGSGRHRATVRHALSQEVNHGVRCNIRCRFGKFNVGKSVYSCCGFETAEPAGISDNAAVVAHAAQIDRGVVDRHTVDGDRRRHRIVSG